VSFSFQTSETEKAFGWSAMLQDFARGCSDGGKKLGTK
jgi:hypothetical protein